LACQAAEKIGNAVGDLDTVTITGAKKYPDRSDWL
jgi:hypothetical protein